MDTKALNPESTCDHMSDKIQRNVKNNQLFCSKLNLIMVFILTKDMLLLFIVIDISEELK